MDMIAMGTIQTAGKMSTKGLKNMFNGLTQMMQLEGWSKDEAPAKFVAYCLQGAEDYKKENVYGYMLKDADDAGNIALFVDNALGQIIIDRL